MQTVSTKKSHAKKSPTAPTAPPPGPPVPIVHRSDGMVNPYAVCEALGIPRNPVLLAEGKHRQAYTPLEIFTAAVSPLDEDPVLGVLDWIESMTDVLHDSLESPGGLATGSIQSMMWRISGLARSAAAMHHKIGAHFTAEIARLEGELAALKKGGA